MLSRVAVVVATRDRRPSLLRSLDRLTALPGRPRVVVVDNASADGTPAAVRGRFPGVELLTLPVNAGAAARNAGAARVAEPYVAFSDDDSWWAPGALQEAAALLDAHPRLGLIAAHVLVGDAGRVDPTCVAMARSPLPRPGDVPGVPVLGFLACGAVVRRSAFQEAGGFHPRFGVGSEEALLAVDMARRGWALSYVAGVVAHHHPAGGRGRAERDRARARNAIWSLWLRRRPGTALRRTLRIAAYGSPRDAGAVLAQAARGAPWIARERAPVPAELEARLAMLEDRRG